MQMRGLRRDMQINGLRRGMQMSRLQRAMQMSCLRRDAESISSATRLRSPRLDMLPPLRR